MDHDEKKSHLMSVLFGGTLGGIIALFLSAVMLMGNFFMVTRYADEIPRPPYLLLLLSFVLFFICGAYIAHKRYHRRKSAGGEEPAASPPSAEKAPQEG
ncbi:MAG: hypothetical protein RDV48_20680 [Candidatus Eremiobacteraeota bacterium]|nr:hypothetical protein [Candidatus Eremiobacteraeota bacterium]